MRLGHFGVFLLCGLLAAAGAFAAVRFWSPVHPTSTIGIAPPLEQVVLGEVHENQGPIAGARVHFKGLLHPATLTDGQGVFRLAGPPRSSARITAWKAGYRIGGVAADASSPSILLRPLPSKDFEAYRWVDATPNADKPGNCGNCHAEIHREWIASGHARSLTNRRFLNVYDGTDWSGRGKAGWNLLADNPDGAGVCTSCHAPTVGFDEPGYFDLRQVRGTATRGVHCDYCHKIADVENGKIGLTHGRFGLRLLRPEKGQIFLGPLDDVDAGDDSFSPIYQESRYCASCHEGTVFGVHVYSTYTEWLESPARALGKECQTCHMAPTGKLTNFAPGKGGIERDPQTLANHTLFAGSQRAMLEHCMHVEITISADGKQVQATVALDAAAVGHRVPTGFADRNLFLVLEGRTADGKPVAPEGSSPRLPAVAGKSFQGLAGQLFAKQLSDFSARQPVPFWRASPETADTRMVPGQDCHSAYTFGSPVSRLRVRLLYRRFWPEVAEAKGWPDDSLAVLDQELEVRPGQELRWAGP